MNPEEIEFTQEVRARCEEVPAIGYLVTAADDDFPFTRRFAYIVSHLTHTDIPRLLAIISALSADLDKAVRGLLYYESLTVDDYTRARTILDEIQHKYTATTQVQEQDDMPWLGDSLNLPDPEDPQHPWNKGAEQKEKEATE